MGERVGHPCVERLAELVGLVERTVTSFGWEAVEGSLGGLRLPGDYRAVVETFPPGRFQGVVSVIRPGDAKHPETDYLGYYHYRLEDMRTTRADEDDPASFPYPIFPEPDGLLPWGAGRRGELYFWLTDSNDPEDWSVVYADADWVDWQTVSGSMCEFLTRLVTGQIEGLTQGTGTPFFEGRAPSRGQTLTGPAWERPNRGGPRDESVLLAGVVLPGAGATTVPDWQEVEHGLGCALPGDYRSFVEACGPGRFCDIDIAAPDPCYQVDLRSLLVRKHDRAASSRRVRELVPYYPEPSGIVAWGESADGWTLGWGAAGADPDRWGVVVARPYPDLGTTVYFPDLSFSAFLLRYCGYNGNAERIFEREPWRGPITFVPHVHESSS